MPEAGNGCDGVALRRPGFVRARCRLMVCWHMAYPLPAELEKRSRWRADQIRDGEPYEVSDGRRIYCAPTGGRGSGAVATGAAVLKSDPAVSEAGVDTGYTPDEHTLRAPDVAVGNVPDEPGWVSGVPGLAVEYADTGQDEASLQAKIDDMFAAGNKLLWVVRLDGPRRIEVHAPGQPMRVVRAGELLTAPGMLAEPVPVEAMYDWQAGKEVVLRNLLHAKGYRDLDEVRSEGQDIGRLDGLRSAVLTVLETRGLAVSDELRAAVTGCGDAAILDRWLQQAATVERAEQVLTEL